MKKIVKFLSLTLVILVIMYLVLELKEQYPIYQLNKSLDAYDLHFQDSPDDLQEVLKDFDFEGGFGGEFYKIRNSSMKIAFSGFPDALDNHLLTNIEFNTNTYKVFNITTDTSIIDAKSILQENNYSIDDNSNSSTLSFTNGVVNIKLKLDVNSQIESIRINLISTNKDGVIF